MDLKEVTTKDLLRELALREGVQKTTVEPYKDMELKVSGPAVVLVIID